MIPVWERPATWTLYLPQRSLRLLAGRAMGCTWTSTTALSCWTRRAGTSFPFLVLEIGVMRPLRASYRAALPLVIRGLQKLPAL
eukprot:3044875-Pyramimonas_sp.AAC.1